MEWNRPSRTDNQLVLIASLIGNMFAKSPKKMSDFQLKYTFKTKSEIDSEETLKRREELSKAVWGGLAAGPGATHKRISRKQAIEEGRIEG